MSGERAFPVLRNPGERDADRVGPSSVPWVVVAPHEAQAMANHGGQSLARLAQRGGLSLLELYYVLRDEPWPWGGPTVSKGAAAAYIAVRVRGVPA